MLVQRKRPGCTTAERSLAPRQCQEALGVVGDRLDPSVAGHRGDTDDLELRARQSEGECQEIVEARVGVDVNSAGRRRAHGASPLKVPARIRLL